MKNQAATNSSTAIESELRSRVSKFLIKVDKLQGDNLDGNLSNLTSNTSNITPKRFIVIKPSLVAPTLAGFEGIQCTKSYLY